MCMCAHTHTHAHTKSDAEPALYLGVPEFGSQPTGHTDGLRTSTVFLTDSRKFLDLVSRPWPPLSTHSTVHCVWSCCCLIHCNRCTGDRLLCLSPIPKFHSVLIATMTYAVKWSNLRMKYYIFENAVIVFAVGICNCITTTNLSHLIN
jgi:hypothetical protein